MHNLYLVMKVADTYGFMGAVVAARSKEDAANLYNRHEVTVKLLGVAEKNIKTGTILQRWIDRPTY